MTPQRAREILNQFAHWSEAERSALLNEEEKGEHMNPREDDEEDYPDEDWEDYPDDALIASVCPPQPQPQLYRSALLAMVQGTEHHVLLLKPAYVFDAAHRLEDILPFEFGGDGYPQGGVRAGFSILDDFRLELNEVRFPETMTGEFSGGVVYNEIGPIVYLPMAGGLNGEQLTIRGEG